MPTLLAAPPGGSPASAADAVDPELIRFLNEVPTEATLGERMLLYKLFASAWSGAGLVVEIGPFLGGTTRAIACGMAQNPRRAPGAVLHTFDRFDCYYSAAQMRRTVQPMVEKNIFTAATADDLCRDLNFRRLFDAIHSPHPYAELVRLHDSPLPDTPAELPTAASFACIDDGTPISALFVDGCKSWTSTYFALLTLLPRLPAGAPVIFQDFGWYTCYWISAAAHALRDLFEFVSAVDTTYVFCTRRALHAEDIVQRLKPTPEAMGEAFFGQAATALLADSVRRQDLRGELVAKLHLVAALISLGHKRQAADVLKSINPRRYPAHVDMIAGCLKSPTYHSGSTPILWDDAG